MPTPDYAWTVKITPDRTLNEDGRKELDDAITEADIKELIRVAIWYTLDRGLPQKSWDLTPRSSREMADWYELEVRAIPDSGGG